MKTNERRALLLLVFFAMLLCAGCSSGEYSKMKMSEAQEKIEAGTDYLIVDVRTQEEYDEGHIPGAILVPIEDIREEKLDKLPDKEQKMMVYCWTGRRSEDSVKLLVEYGYTNVCDIGGFIDWQGETESGNGT